MKLFTLEDLKSKLALLSVELDLSEAATFGRVNDINSSMENSIIQAAIISTFSCTQYTLVFQTPLFSAVSNIFLSQTEYNPKRRCIHLCS